MKLFAAVTGLIISVTAAIPYFKHVREVQSPAAGSQAYVVVDESVWQHSRPDLADLRLYAGSEVPYAITIEQGSSETDQKTVRVLQPGSVGTKTQFFLDMAGVAEYDRIELRLKSKNFVANAKIEGQDDLHGPRWVELGNAILYDLSGDSLGGNSTLRLPLTTYKYLRITLDGPVTRSDVEGATAAERQEQRAVWRDIGGEPQREQQGKDTVFVFSEVDNVPTERVEFAIDPSQGNFLRQVEIQNEKKQELGSGELSRVHLVRHGQKIDYEQSNLDFHHTGDSKETLRIVIHNGDDPPLKISGVHLQQYQRRLYFKSTGDPLRLYYGDEKLESPEYDYAKLFQEDPHAVQAQLGPEQANAGYTGRPDDRPWSERHPIVLWIAIIAAVLVLGAMALRSMRAATAQ